MNLYAVVLTVIVVVLLAVSLSQIRKVKTKADYLVAGRTLPWYVLVFTLLSSWIGSGSLFGGAENAFKNGFPALWQPAGGWFGLLVILVVAPRARKFAQFEPPPKPMPPLPGTRITDPFRTPLGMLTVKLSSFV